MATLGARAWILEPGCARRLIAAGALVLDARPDGMRAASPLPGACAADWRRFSRVEPALRGRLLDDDAELTARLRAIGVCAGVPIVVVADPPRGWGEDGRIVWMLRALGHADAALVDGGIAALCAEGQPAIAPRPMRGDFVVARDERHAMECEALRRRLGATDLAILDSRSAAEFAGATPHGESRGGHIPGARHLPYGALMGGDGRLLTPSQIRKQLADAGVHDEMEIVTYCTGGVRSAWLAAVLIRLGYRARNFAGSIWEWSAAPAATHPLVAHA